VKVKKQLLDFEKTMDFESFIIEAAPSSIFNGGGSEEGGSNEKLNVGSLNWASLLLKITFQN